jgi:methylthioribose-1-phosphate isomerase
MASGDVDAVIVGADRIAANGDVANKVGTYSLAVLADHHGVPFYVAAPVSTLDRQTPTGAEIPVERRSAEEVAEIGGRRIAPRGAPVENRAFDVTPAELVSAWITDAGVHKTAAELPSEDDSERP